MTSLTATGTPKRGPRLFKGTESSSFVNVVLRSETIACSSSSNNERTALHLTTRRLSSTYRQRCPMLSRGRVRRCTTPKLMVMVIMEDTLHSKRRWRLRIMRIRKHTWRQRQVCDLRTQARRLMLIPTARILFRLIIISRKNGLLLMIVEVRCLRISIIGRMDRGILRGTR